MNKEFLLLYNVGSAQTAAIKKLAGNMRIKVTEVPENSFGCLIGDVYEGRVTPETATENRETPKESIVVFAGVTEKHFDRLLFEMRRQGIAVDYKAVMTDTNRTWNAYRLYANMEHERRSYEQKK